MSLIFFSLNPMTKHFISLFRSLCVDTDGVWAAIGFSSGVVSVLDIRMGIMMSVRKQTPDTDIVAMCSVSNRQFLTAASDQTVSVSKIICTVGWRTDLVPTLRYHMYFSFLVMGNWFFCTFCCLSFVSRTSSCHQYVQ